MDFVAQQKGVYARLRGLWSQIAFFTRDGDMRDRRSRISRPKRGALIRATNLKLTPMGAPLVGARWVAIRGGAGGHKGRPLYGGCQGGTEAARQTPLSFCPLGWSEWVILSQT